MSYHIEIIRLGKVLVLYYYIYYVTQELKVKVGLKFIEKLCDTIKDILY